MIRFSKKPNLLIEEHLLVSPKFIDHRASMYDLIHGEFKALMDN